MVRAAKHTKREGWVRLSFRMRFTTVIIAVCGVYYKRPVPWFDWLVLSIAFPPFRKLRERVGHPFSSYCSRQKPLSMRLLVRALLRRDGRWRGYAGQGCWFFFLQLGQGAFEGQVQDFVHGVDEVELHDAFQVLGQVGQVLFV